uniref:Uncharacterized protein n=1 Tax=Onchocerca volvulus TaxID=6282 RepID=A0A8R1TMZ5_ONCVO
MLKEVLNVVKDTKIELIGVTVLTSMSNKDLSKLGIARRTKSQHEPQILLLLCVTLVFVTRDANLFRLYILNKL